MIEKLTRSAVEVTSFLAEAFTVFIEEYEDESVGVGGQPLSETSNK
ncbi:MAG: tautomerase family protein [Desulfotomaculaceae bacterium]|nr:tautomerase family protein [Desulfotomaculaceae bacterium]